MIDPFANDHQSMQIGELVIENQTDKIIIYGDVDLQLNESGRQRAQELHELTGKILQAFEDSANYNKNDKESKLISDAPDETIDNPFL